MSKLPTIHQDASLRVLIVETPGYPTKRQRDECASYANGLEFDSFSEWIDMARAKDCLIVASLRLLGIERKKTGKRRRPTAALHRRLAEAMATRSIIIEASTGARSDDRKRWPEAVERANNWLRSGGVMTKAEAKRRGREGGRKGGAVLSARSAETRWAAMPHLLTKYRAVWKGGEFENDSAALRGINEMLVQEGQAGMAFGSVATLRRVLGNKR